jgi:hypothetical protein
MPLERCRIVDSSVRTCPPLRCTIGHRFEGWCGPHVRRHLDRHRPDSLQSGFEGAPRRIARQLKAHQRCGHGQRERCETHPRVCPSASSGGLYGPSAHGSPLDAGGSIARSGRAAATSGPRKRSIRRRMAANRARDIATSAKWKTTGMRAPILASFSRSMLIDHRATSFGSASERSKLARLRRARTAAGAPHFDERQGRTAASSAAP